MEFYNDPPELRGTGRTFRQIEALPDNSIFVVPNSAMKSYCKNIQMEHFPSKNITFVTLENVKYQFRGRSFAGYGIDHCMKLNQREWEDVHNSLIPCVSCFNKDSNAITTPSH